MIEDIRKTFKDSKELKKTSLGGFFFAMLYLVLPLFAAINIATWLDLKMSLSLLLIIALIAVSFLINRKRQYANKHKF